MSIVATTKIYFPKARSYECFKYLHLLTIQDRLIDNISMNNFNIYPGYKKSKILLPITYYLLPTLTDRLVRNIS
jgi:hypothetical protein